MRRVPQLPSLNFPANSYFTDETPFSSWKKSPLLAKCSDAQYGIVFFALIALVCLGLQLHRCDKENTEDYSTIVDPALSEAAQ